MTAAHRNAVLRDELAEEPNAFLLAHVGDERRVPIGHARFNAELSFPAWIQQVLEPTRQLLLANEVGVVRLHPEREIRGDPAAMRAQRAFQQFCAVRRHDRLQNALAIERLHLDGRGVDRVDIMTAGGGLGDRTLQDVLRRRTPQPDFDAVALIVGGE